MDKQIQILINGRMIEIDDLKSLNIILNKSITDFNDPFVRLGDFSYSINIPKTKKNQITFKNIEHPHTINKFNQSDEFITEIIVDGNNVITGKFILNNVTDKFYIGNIFSENISWGDDIEKKTLKDLNFPPIPVNGLYRSNDSTNPNIYFTNSTSSTNTFDLSVNAMSDNIESNPWKDKVQFSILPYGNFRKEGANDRKNIISNFSHEEITPTFNLIYVFRQIFKDIGYTVSGDFVDDAEINRIFFTYSGNEVIWNWNQITKFGGNGSINSVDNNSTPIGYIPENTIKRFYPNCEYIRWDFLNSYNASNPNFNNDVGYEYICQVSGKYRFKLDITLNPKIACVDLRNVVNANYFYPNPWLRFETFAFVKDTNSYVDSDVIRNYINALPSVTFDNLRKIQDENFLAYFMPLAYTTTNPTNWYQSNINSNYFPENQSGLADSYVNNNNIGHNENTTITRYESNLRLNTVYAYQSIGSFVHINSPIMGDSNAPNKRTYFEFDTTLEKGEIIRLIHLFYNRDWREENRGLWNGNHWNNDYNINSLTIQCIDERYDEQFSIQKNLKEINQKEFVKEIIKLFNLYFQVDNNNKEITFLRRKKFFKNTTSIDLSKRINMKEAKFEPVSSYKSIIYGLTNADDDDFKTSNFQEKTYEITKNIYSKDSVDVRSKLFSPAKDVLYTVENNTSQISLPNMGHGEKIFEPRAEASFDYNTNMRLLYKGSYVNGTLSNFMNLNNAIYINSRTSLFKIPRFEFINTAPNGLQLNYESTGKTLFTEYQFDKFFDLSASHIVKVNCNLKNYEYSKLELDKYTFIDNEVYYINAIKNFDVLESEPCELTLLKLV